MTKEAVDYLLISKGYKVKNYSVAELLSNYIPYVNETISLECYLGNRFLESELSPVAIDYTENDVTAIEAFIDYGVMPPEKAVE